MRQPIIKTFGKFRPTGGGDGSSEVLSRLKGLAGQAQGIAFNLGAEQAKKEGELEGAQSVVREGGETKAPELRRSTLSIRDKAFDNAAILAHRAALQTDAKNKLDELQREESQDPAKFELRASAYKEGLLSDMPEELAVLVGADIDSSIVSRASKLDEAFFKRIEQQNLATLNEGLEAFTDDILNATRDGDEQRVKDLSVQAEAMINQAVDSGTLDPTKAESIRENLRERGVEQKTLGEIDRVVFDESLPLEERLDKGVKFLESLRDRDFKDLDPNQKDSLIRVVGGRVLDIEKQVAQKNSQRNIELEKQVSNLKVSAKQGFDTAANLMERIETMHNQGFISGNERTSMINDVYSSNRAATKKAQDFSLVTKKLTGDFPEIVLQQKTIDDYYDQVYASGLEQMDGQERNAYQAQYVSVLKGVPKSVKDQITNDLLSGDQDLVAGAADLIDRIDNVAGLQEMAVNANQRAFASVLTGLMVAMEPEQAAQKALELTDPNNTARIEAREQLIKTDKLPEKYSDWVEDGFESILGKDYLIDNVNKQSVEAEFKDIFESLYKAGMSEDQSKDKAIQLLQRNWKESQFGFMKHPPEQFYQVGANADYIKDQLIEDLVIGTNIQNIDKDKLYLISDERTSREAASRNPSYQIRLFDSNGEFLAPILTDEHGEPTNRWAPDRDKELQKQLADKEKKAQDVRLGKGGFEEVTSQTAVGKLFESLLKDVK